MVPISNEPNAPTSAIPEAATRLLAPLTDLVIQAGAAILAIDRSRMDIAGKSDGSPVTQADLAADHVIAEGLARLAPDIAVVSEERTISASALSATFFLVDPLDGTKEFVAGRNEFTINLALVSGGTPVLGIVAAPALSLIWRGVVGLRAERLSTTRPGRAEPIRTRAFPPAGQAWIAAVSRSHRDASSEAFIDARAGATRHTLGSAVKFAKVAEGAADIYPRLGPTREWDVAAGSALVAAAGGKITDADGGDLRFGRLDRDFVVPGFIAWGDPNAAR